MHLIVYKNNDDDFVRTTIPISWNTFLFFVRFIARCHKINTHNEEKNGCAKRPSLTINHGHQNECYIIRIAFDYLRFFAVIIRFYHSAMVMRMCTWVIATAKTSDMCHRYTILLARRSIEKPNRTQAHENKEHGMRFIKLHFYFYVFKFNTSIGYSIFCFYSACIQSFHSSTHNPLRNRAFHSKIKHLCASSQRSLKLNDKEKKQIDYSNYIWSWIIQCMTKRRNRIWTTPYAVYWTSVVEWA